MQGWLALIAVRCSALPAAQISPVSPQYWRQVSLDILDTIEECSKHLVRLLSFAHHSLGQAQACLFSHFSCCYTCGHDMNGYRVFVYSQALRFWCMRTKRAARILGLPLHCAWYGQRALSTNRLKFPFCNKRCPEYLLSKQYRFLFSQQCKNEFSIHGGLNYILCHYKYRAVICKLYTKLGLHL